MNASCRRSSSPARKPAASVSHCLSRRQPVQRATIKTNGGSTTPPKPTEHLIDHWNWPYRRLPRASPSLCLTKAQAAYPPTSASCAGTLSLSLSAHVVRHGLPLVSSATLLTLLSPRPSTPTLVRRSSCRQGDRRRRTDAIARYTGLLAVSVGSQPGPASEPPHPRSSPHRTRIGERPQTVWSGHANTLPGPSRFVPPAAP